MTVPVDSQAEARPAVAIFSPDPLLSITIEPAGGADEIHLHPAGQGVWVARMATELGALPVLCGLAGGEAGAVLGALLSVADCVWRPTAAAGGMEQSVAFFPGGSGRNRGSRRALKPQGRCIVSGSPPAGTLRRPCRNELADR